MKRSVTQLVARRCSNKKDLLRHPTTSSAALRRQGGGVLSTAASHFSSLAMSGPLKMHSAYSCLMTNGPRMLYSSLPDDPSQYYTIEASNADREDATKLTVRGPDVDGILASMTVALAMNGCSLVELHAAMAVDVSHAKHAFATDDDDEPDMIQDVFFVVDRNTGGQFEDSKLEELAIALLNAASSPLNVISNKGALGAPPAPAKDPVPIDPARQVTIIPSSNS